MDTARELARVDAELASGGIAAARQRLRLLVRYEPRRLDLRERLAEMYRDEGDDAQAGRWSYLADDPDPDEVTAFHARYPDPMQLMTALEWSGSDDDAPTAAARERLARVRSDAKLAVGRVVTWDEARAMQGPKQEFPHTGARSVLRRFLGPQVPLADRVMLVGLAVLIVTALVAGAVWVVTNGVELPDIGYEPR